MPLSRRDMLFTTAASTLALLNARCSRENDPSVQKQTRRGAILEWSASEMATAIREKEVSSEELIRLALSRIEQVNPHLNAVVQVRAERALDEARAADAALRDGKAQGALHGVPMTIKDSFDTAGVISTAGTKGRANFIPQTDATVVARFKQAGAILLGKTNTPEFTLLPETDNFVYGRTNNPYDHSRTPGGSSGGAAAIVAAGGSAFDIGSDTGGSVRMPAHYCGVTGLKPTSGRVPRTGHIISFGGAMDSFTHVGPIARRVEDLGLLLSVMAGSDWRDPSITNMPMLRPEDVRMPQLRVAFFINLEDVTPTAATADAVRSAARILSEAGAVVEEAKPPRVDTIGPYLEVGFADGAEWIRRLVNQAGTTEVSPGIHEMITQVKPSSSGQLMSALEEVDRYRSDVLSFMQRFDALLCPVDAGPAFPHGRVPETAFRYLIPFNITGQPAVVVRAGTSPEGLPVGVQIVARRWREDVALALAALVEARTGGWVPPNLQSAQS